MMACARSSPLATATKSIFSPSPIASGQASNRAPIFSAVRSPPAVSRSGVVAGTVLGTVRVDPHLHIESSMVTACAYAEAALINGTTTIVCDSHEIGNVLDVNGVEWMLEDARAAPLNIFLTVPSTVPATTPDLETSA
jgi:hypothetical protein